MSSVAIRLVEELEAERLAGVQLYPGRTPRRVDAHATAARLQWSEAQYLDIIRTHHLPQALDLQKWCLVEASRDKLVSLCGAMMSLMHETFQGMDGFDNEFLSAEDRRVRARQRVRTNPASSGGNAEELNCFSSSSDE